MVVVKRPTVVIFGWKSPGLYNYISENKSLYTSIYGWIDIHSFDLKDSVRWKEIFIELNSDLVISIGKKIESPYEYFNDKIVFFETAPEDEEITSFILLKITEQSCKPYSPKFSVFTPTYLIGERILKSYESLLNQSITDWEWVIVDDSPQHHMETWEILEGISKEDPRVKIYKIYPNSNGFVGKAKKRACSLTTGEWLVELDHDDYLIENCFETLIKASEKFPDAGFIYSDCTEVDDNYTDYRFYYDYTGEDFYARDDNNFNFGYSGNTWEIINNKKYLRQHYGNINPLTIRFNISMPNHVRVWKRDLYFKIGGHSELLPVADDYELIVKTFLTTRIIHIKKLLYVQRYKFGSTVDENSFEINRRSRLVRDFYDLKIHQRIKELGFNDWEWCEASQKCIHQENFYKREEIKYFDDEQILNYIYE